MTPPAISLSYAVQYLTLGLALHFILAILRMYWKKKHRDELLEEEKKQTEQMEMQTSLLMSIDRRMRGMEVFGSISKNEELKG